MSHQEGYSAFTPAPGMSHPTCSVCVNLDVFAAFSFPKVICTALISEWINSEQERKLLKQPLGNILVIQIEELLVI